MASPKSDAIERTVIFSFFLGLMVVAFIGVGVYTFYPIPEAPYEEQLQTLQRQQEDVERFQDADKLTDAERQQLRATQDRIRDLEPDAAEMFVG